MLIVEGIFGIGLNSEVRGLARAAIELINAKDCPVVAVDIASGVSSDTGAILGSAIEAELTVTFGFAKYGHVSFPGAANCGALEVVDIGFPEAALAEVSPRGRWLEAAEVSALIRARDANSHKGNFGHPLIVAGSRGKSGAALLAARGALRCGAGLVSAAIPESVAAIVAAGQAELMTEAIADRDGVFDGAEFERRFDEVAARKTAIVAGPGIGVSEQTRRLVNVLVERGANRERPLVLDADALNAIAELGCEMLKRAQGPIVLTPHPGEMARLLRISSTGVNADRISAARRLSERTGAFVLLKGARSVIASPDGTVYVNSTGNPGMGTPGMGDALCGMLGAILGQGTAPMEALALGVFLHGYAADRVAAKRGEVGYITGDLIDELPAALRALAQSGGHQVSA